MADEMIDQDVVQRVLGAGLRTGAEFSEVYVEDKRSSSANLDDGKVEQVTSGRDRGAGIRVVKGETTGYAHTADLSEAGLLAAAEAAAAAASQGGGGARIVALTRRPAHRVSDVAIAPDTIGKAAKVQLLLRADEAARGAGAAIVQVSAGYGDSRKRILVANSDGVLADDEQVRTLFRVSVVASGDTGLQTGYESLGHTIGFELFDQHDVEEMARRAAQQALTKLNARPAPSGSLPVVIRRGSGGVLFHEACGHGLEADLVGQGRIGVQGPGRRAGRGPDGDARRRRHDVRRVGRHRLRRRGPRLPAQRPHPGRRPHRLHVGLPPLPQGGSRPRAATAAGRATCTCPWSA